MKMILFLLTTTLCIAITAPAAADPPVPNISQRNLVYGWSRSDQNKDGKLEAEELLAWEAKLDRATKARFDRDGDGKWNESERRAALFALVEPNSATAVPHDKDGDGKLSADERKAAREASSNERKKLIEEFDKDKNGKLDKAEKDAMYAKWYEARKQAQLAIFGDALAQLESKEAKR